MKNFVAFDFDTANSSRHSICCVGLVFVENGKIIDSIFQLINPEEEFDRFNSSVHQITEEAVKNAPTFAVFYNSVRDRIADKLMVSHNLLVNGYALKENLLKNKIKPCSNQLLCSYQLAKKVTLNPSSYSLLSLCKHYRIELPHHQNALGKAEACAKLWVQLVEEFDLYDFDSLFLMARIIPGEISNDNFSPSLVKSSKYNWVNIPSIMPSKNAATENVFFGKNVVFTKKLNHFTRREAAQLVISQGGRFQSGITNETDYLVVGQLEEVMAKGNKSSKLLKAEKLILEGKNLEILSEELFMKMANKS